MHIPDWLVVIVVLNLFWRIHDLHKEIGALKQRLDDSDL